MPLSFATVITKSVCPHLPMSLPRPYLPPNMSDHPHDPFDVQSSRAVEPVTHVGRPRERCLLTYVFSILRSIYLDSSFDAMSARTAGRALRTGVRHNNILSMQSSLLSVWSTNNGMVPYWDHWRRWNVFSATLYVPLMILFNAALYDIHCVRPSGSSFHPCQKSS